MEGKKFTTECKKVYQRVFDAFEEIDPDIAEAEIQLDNISITFEDGTCFVLNRQAAKSQIWLATKRRGYHFNFDPEKKVWICDKEGRELFEVLSQSINEKISQKISFPES